MSEAIVVVNGGSTSLKFAAYACWTAAVRHHNGLRCRVRTADGNGEDRRNTGYGIQCRSVQDSSIQAGIEA